MEKENKKPSAIENLAEDNDPRAYGRQMGRKALEELREEVEHPLVPTADIDMIWIFSAPGTIKQPGRGGVYEGGFSNSMCIDHAVDMARQITALRLNKDIDDVTKEDIGEHGPKLYYNGEDETTASTNYPSQNKDLAELISEPDFPIPESNFIIDHIDLANTPGQFEGFIKYLKENPNATKKVATVEIGAHSVRVSRYLEHYKDQFPADIDFVNSPARQTHNPVGTTLREIRKVAQYVQKGDMSEKSYFHDKE